MTGHTKRTFLYDGTPEMPWLHIKGKKDLGILKVTGSLEIIFRINDAFFKEQCSNIEKQIIYVCILYVLG